MKICSLNSSIDISQSEFFENIDSGIRIDLFRCKKIGNHITFYINATALVDINPYKTVAHTSPQYCPVQDYEMCPVRTPELGYPEIGTAWFYFSGELNVYGNIAKNTSMYIQGGYVVGDRT